jgi:hypothetical protein
MVRLVAERERTSLMLAPVPCEKRRQGLAARELIEVTAAEPVRPMGVAASRKGASSGRPWRRTGFSAHLGIVDHVEAVSQW